MKKKSNLVSILGLIGTVLGLIAPVISDWARDKEIDEIIDKKVEAALKERS